MSVPGALLRLRVRLTALFTVVAAAVLVLFVLLLLTTSTRLGRQRLDSDLAGAASRATALIYDDEDDGLTHVEGVADDDLVTRGMPMLVVERTATGPAGTTKAPAGTAAAGTKVLLAVGSCDRTAALALAARAADGIRSAGTLDRAVYGTVGVDGEPRRAAALAWVHDDDRPGGAVVVVAAAPVELATDRLLMPAVAGGLGVLALLAAMTWLVAGRSLRPAAAALADRETFLSTAAHELRGPVARLRAGAEAARRAVRPGDPVAPALAQLVTVADSAAHVVSNLLLATRAERGDIPVVRRPVDLAALAGELEHAYPTVVVDVVEPVVVDGDPALLRHALANLVDNAVRHGRVGDAVPQVDVAVRRHGRHALVRVADDGPGFPPDVDVLARYAIGARGGTGLGLPLVAWIMARHGGALQLGPPAGGAIPGAASGAVVQLRLPLTRTLEADPSIPPGD